MRAAFAILIAVLSVSACGQKGALYLPQDPGPASGVKADQQEDESEAPAEAL